MLFWKKSEHTLFLQTIDILKINSLRSLRTDESEWALALEGNWKVPAVLGVNSLPAGPWVDGEVPGGLGRVAFPANKEVFHYFNNPHSRTCAYWPNIDPV